MYKVQKAKDYMEYVGCLCKGTGTIEGHVSVTLHCYYANPLQDIDSSLKVILDSLQPIYGNDRNVEELHVYKHIDKENPRIEVDLQPLGPTLHPVNV